MKNTNAQEIITIDEALLLMSLNSDEYKAIQREYKIEDIEYRIYRNSFLPRADLDISLPTYNRSINAITQPNGENVFLEQQQANSVFKLNFYQKLPFTGGELLISSSVNRLDLFSSDTKNFSSNWFDVFLTQPLNGYNSFKWGKKVNKVKFEKKNIELYKSSEELNKSLVELYFQVYVNQQKINLTRNNISATSEYLKNAEILFSNGRILKPEVLKAKLSLNQLKKRLENNKMNYENSIARFKFMIGANLKDSIVLSEPRILKKPTINTEVLEQRVARFSLEYGFELDLLMSEQNVAKAKSNRGLQAELQVSYGLNSNNNEFSELYQTPSRREYLNFGINVPVLNWNENSKRYQIELLKSKNLKEFYNSQKKKNHLQVRSYIMTLEGLYNQLEYTRQNIKIAQLNSDIAKERIALNRLTINDYNREILKEEKIILDYLSNIEAIWLNRFFLRRTTLFDFFTNESLFME